MSAPPLLSRTAPPPPVGIVHLGPGAFFRAFVAPYTSEAMAASGGDWGIRGISLRSTGVRDRLAPQGYAYASVSLAPGGGERQVIECLSDILVLPEDPAAAVAALADPAVRIVSLTVTEKGYCHAPATGELNRDDPDVRHDLAQPDAPRTAPGLLVAGLAARRDAGLPPFTVLSCDNLPSNGALTRRVVLAMAQARDPALAGWIAEHGRFPCCMVDRITPAATEADIAEQAERSGVLDRGIVLHEPFRQWVIEDDFVNGQRPAWEAAGALMVRDVAPFETMKLRCLNGTHSALAYLGYLAGHRTVAEAVADPPFAALCRHLWQREIVPTFAAPPGVDLDAYCAALLERYRNPAIRHLLWQIAMDGSQKLPQRILATAADALAAGRRIDGLALVVAGWMRFVGGVDEAGAPIDVRDPLAERLRQASDGAATADGKVAALLGFEEIFAPALARDPAFAGPVAAAYRRLVGQGARAAVSALGRD